MDFAEARQAHASWKVRIKESISGRSTEKLDPVVVAKDTACTLGQWLSGDGPRVCNVPPGLLAEVKKLHGEFHRLTSGLVKRANDGAKGEPLAALGPDSEFSKLSNKINALLIELEAKCKNGNPNGK